MTAFFVNLPLKFVFSGSEYLDLFLDNGICPELGVDAQVVDFTGPDRHSQAAAAFRSRNIAVSIHMPFMDLQPGSLDGLILEATAERLVQGAGICAHYQPRHIVVHTGYRPEIHENEYARWLERSVATWKKVLEVIPDVPVYVENVYEQEPFQIHDLLVELGGRAGFCFDLGHWFSFGGGRERQDLEFWMQTMAPYLRHLHLHDNVGSRDEHLGLGRGEIPFRGFFAGLELLDTSPGFTLEPHTLEAFEQSLEFILSNPYWFALLGMKQEDFDQLEILRARLGN